MREGRDRRPSAVHAVPLLALSLFACGEMKKATECSAVIDSVNAAAAAEPKDTKKDDFSEDVKLLAESIAKLEKVEVTDAGLKKRVGDYRGILKDTADTLQAMDALAKKAEKPGDQADVDKMTEEALALEKKLRDLDDGQEKIVEDLNAYCGRE
ncbi:MAG TPA: hypothetical protein VL400_03805 [Polyangiaceae bacterium]|jgi:hypothetical protein|nr:hypothetical protein [Polyangiaceae bacterium]